MWQFGSCSRCKGDLYVSQGLDGWYEQCLQCGSRQRLQEISPKKKRTPKKCLIDFDEEWSESEEGAAVDL
jgi:hypothetical protein